MSWEEKGYDYNSATGTYVRNPGRVNYPPPIPPKEIEADFPLSPVKESQHDIDGSDVDVSGLSLDEKPSPRRRKRKIRVLSLDGGGIRGYSSLVILQELMHQVYVQSHNGQAPKSTADLPRPCDYFDLIGGNGTGGLIALMLGRMRMDVRSCMQYYEELTRFVFITDKTLMGVPYGKTLFKASRLEEAIKHCVRESTRFDSEKIIPHSPPPSELPRESQRLQNRRSNSWKRHHSEDYDSRGRSGRPSRRRGNADAPLLDKREGSCKTFVTAMLQGSGKGTTPALLRSYFSPAETTNPRTTIWQAGRATCATLAAFKPITIDNTHFLDEGAGQYNPAFQALEEARCNEFPDDDVCVFVSIGTGKYKTGSAESAVQPKWWEGVVATPFDDFTKARRRLLRRIDDCERVHRELVEGIDGGRPRLAQRGVALEDYYRFNVEVGVGEFGMNEWHRIAEVSTGTQRYLKMREVHKLVKESAGKLVAIENGHHEQGTKIKFRPHSINDTTNYVAELETPTSSTSSPNTPTSAYTPQKSAPIVDHRLHRRHESMPHISSVTSQPRPQFDMPTIISPPPRPPSKPMPYMPSDEKVPMSPPPDSPGMARPPKSGRPLVAANPYADTPNPEIRVTSPSTVAGGSDDEDDEMYPGFGRKRQMGSGKRRKGRRRPSMPVPYPVSEEEDN